MADQIPRSSRVLLDDLADESPAEARRRRTDWRRGIRGLSKLKWLTSADVSNPTDVELDAIWAAGGQVDVGRSFAAVHLLAAYRAGVAAGRTEATS